MSGGEARRKPGSPGGGKGPWFERNVERRKGLQLQKEFKDAGRRRKRWKPQASSRCATRYGTTKYLLGKTSAETEGLPAVDER